MLTDATIMDTASRQAFKRGEDLVAEGGVLSWRIGSAPSAANADPSDANAYEPELLESIAGTVEDRTGHVYTTSVQFDLVAERIASHSCSCPVHASLEGMCKHCVALALTYLDACEKGLTCSAPDGTADPSIPSDSAELVDTSCADTSATGPRGSRPISREDEIIHRLKAQTQELIAQYRVEEAAAMAQRRGGPIQEAQTSPQVSKLIYAYSETLAQEALPDAAPEEERAPQAPVDLYPTLSPAGRTVGSAGQPDACTWEVKLRVGTGRTSYVVRQVDDLVAAWETGAERSYGRHLAFAHTPENFTARAGQLLDLLARVLRSQNAARSAGRAWYGSAQGVSFKALPLSDHDAADLLDIMVGADVQFEPRALSGSPRPRTLAVLDGDPDLALSITHGDRGGYDLELPAGSDCVLAGNRMYLLLGAHAWRCSDSYRARMGAFCRAALPATLPLHIREDDMAGFCCAVLPALKEKARVELPDDLEVLLPAPACFTFKFALVRDHVTCEARVAYGATELDLFEKPRPGQPLRDLARERAAQGLVRAHFTSYLPTFGLAGRNAFDGAQKTYPWQGEQVAGRPCFDAADTEALYRFLTEGLSGFASFGEVLLSENLRSIGVRPAPRVRVQASVKSGLLDIAIDSSDLSPHDLLAYLASFEQKQRFARLADGDIVRLDDGGVRAVAELAAGLGMSAQALMEGTEPIPMNRALFVDTMMKRTCGVRFDRDEGFRSIIRDFDSIGDNDFVEPASLRDVLRPYQREGYKWICTLAKLGFGGILADDMGLGKTLQVIAFLLAQHEAGRAEPSLVVCPASLVYNWTAEFERFAPQLAVAAVVGTREERRALIQTARGYDVLVTSYELLKRDVELYERQRFYCQILDEAQYIKNPSTQAARCAKRVTADVHLALTGTPIENHLSELWSIFDYLMPGLLGSHEAFHRRFEMPIAAEEEAAAKRLQCMVAPFILRRMKGDVLKDLPEKIENVVYAHMTGEQDKLYRATASHLALELAHQLPHEFASRRIAVLAELTRLRQICCDPSLVYENFEGESAKLETCLELVANAVDGGHKVLLFSQFTSMLQIISDRLAASGVAHHRLEGSTPKEERARLVASFATDDVPVFLISLKAGGVGLNLTAADIVIHYDPWWNLAAQNQATDRAHRIGQENAVTVMRLIAKGTIEEKIVQLQEAKRNLAESIMGGDAVGSASLTKEDILALLEE